MREPGVDVQTGALEVDEAIGRRRLRLRAAAFVVAALAAGLLIARLPALREVRARFEHTSAGWVALAVALEIASVAGFVLAFQRALDGLVSWRTSISIGTTAQGVNALVPAGGSGGLAVAAVILRGAGVPAGVAASRMIALFLVAGVATNIAMVIVVGAGLAVGLVPGRISLALALVPAMLAASLVALVTVGAWRVVSRRAASAHAPSGTLTRAVGFLADGLDQSAGLLRKRDPLLVVGSFGYIVCDLATLVAAFAAVGSIVLPFGVIALAYTLGQIGSVISLPGTTEGGLIGVLVLYGAPLGSAVAAVLIYRTISLVVPLALGAIGVSQLRRTIGELRGAPPGWQPEPEMQA